MNWNFSPHRTTDLKGQTMEADELRSVSPCVLWIPNRWAAQSWAACMFCASSFGYDTQNIFWNLSWLEFIVGAVLVQPHHRNDEELFWKRVWANWRLLRRKQWCRTVIRSSNWRSGRKYMMSTMEKTILQDWCHSCALKHNVYNFKPVVEAKQLNICI